MWWRMTCAGCVRRDGRSSQKRKGIISRSYISVRKSTQSWACSTMTRNAVLSCEWIKGPLKQCLGTSLASTQACVGDTLTIGIELTATILVNHCARQNSQQYFQLTYIHSKPHTKTNLFYLTRTSRFLQESQDQNPPMYSVE